MRKPSLKRALGVTKVKRSISKQTGIPLIKSGRKNKMKKIATGGCCSYYIFGLIAFIVLFFIIIINGS